MNNEQKRWWYAAYQNNPGGHNNIDHDLGVGKITYFTFPSADENEAGQAFLDRMIELGYQDYCPCCGSSFESYPSAGPCETLEEVQEEMGNYTWAQPHLGFKENLG